MVRVVVVFLCDFSALITLIGDVRCCYRAPKTVREDGRAEPGNGMEAEISGSRGESKKADGGTGEEKWWSRIVQGGGCRRLGTSQQDNTEEVMREAKSILNKLTPENFEKLVEVIKTLAINTTERLSAFADLIYEQATTEDIHTSLYALLCYVLSQMEGTGRSSGGSQTSGTGSPVKFRNLIINKCQQDFERDNTDEAILERQREIEACVDTEKKWIHKAQLENDLRRLRRRTLCNLNFIGELYKVGMLTSPIMLRITGTLLKRGDEASLEGLCVLLTVIGKTLETHCSQQAKIMSDLESYFKLMKAMVEERRVGNRVRYRLMDVIELREKKWEARRKEAKPMVRESVIHRLVIVSSPSTEQEAGCGSPMSTEESIVKAERAVRSILNKVTTKNLDKISKKVKKLPINTPEEMKAALDVIFEVLPWRTKRNHPIPRRSWLCYDLYLLSKRRYMRDKGSGRFKKESFKDLLTKKCQELEECKTEKVSIERQEEIDACQDARKRLKLELEMDDLLVKLRKRFVNNLKLIGALYTMELITTPTMLDHIEALLNRGDDEALEGLCGLLIIAGKTLEKNSSRQNVPGFKKCFETLKRKVEERQTGNRVRFIIMDIVELKESKWVTYSQMMKELFTVLNQLTPDNYDKLLENIKGKGINTKKKLRSFTNMLFYKAVRHHLYSSTYAQLCQALSSMTVKGDGKESGVNFRNLLINKVQENFEKKYFEIYKAQMQRDIDDCQKADMKQKLEVRLANRITKERTKSVGLTRFIGELYKQKLLTPSIIVRSIGTLLGRENDESLEELCVLLTVSGKALEADIIRKTNLKTDFENHYETIKKIVNGRQTGNRLRFRLLDVIELRDNGWKPRSGESWPMKKDELYEMIRKEVREQKRNVSLAAGEKGYGDEKREGNGSTCRMDTAMFESSGSSGGGQSQTTMHKVSTFGGYIYFNADLDRLWTQDVILQYTCDLDLKSAKVLIKERFPSLTIKSFVQYSLEWVIDKDSEKRKLFGQLYHDLIAEKLLTVQQLQEGSQLIFQSAEEYQVDIPCICDYLGEVFAPCLADETVPLSCLVGLATCIGSKQREMFAATLHHSASIMSPEKIIELLNASALDWTAVMQPDIKMKTTIDTPACT